MVEAKEMSESTLDGPVLGQFMGHEQVVFCNDDETGLKAIIGVHSTTLGPSLGGTRMWTYEKEGDAIRDVLRLSRGMTYKNSLAGLNLGGGKAVIIGDARTLKSPALMRKFGEYVNRLSGNYITAEDVGMTTQDMVYIKEKTDHVAGLPIDMGGSGDPSPVTALGVYMGMKASAKEAWGNDDLAGRKILVQGAGHVGQYLIDYLMKEGANVMVSDIFDDKIKIVTDKYAGVQVVDANSVYDTAMDIYAPCALGATINDNTLAKLKCQIISGAANNQLANEFIHGQSVMDKGILYAPDYLINSGGVINCYTEVAGLGAKWSIEKTEGIYDTTLNIFKLSKEKNIPTYQAANILAEERVQNAKRS
jgi:leucine dehydrogenase